jgi:ribose-phosphate pyrophosphokinase
MKTLGLTNSSICVVSPDAGAVERAKDFAKMFPESSAALIEKTRKKFNEISSMVLIGSENVSGRNVIVIDDMLDTSGTAAKSSLLLREKGALSIRMAVTHFVSSGKALENIYNSAITELVVSDSVSGTYEKVELYNKLYTKPNEFGILPKITVISCADFLAETINRLNNKKSINELNTVK